MFKTLKSTLLGLAGIFGYNAEAKLEADIETTATAPTEGNFDTDILDLEAVVEHLDKNVPVPVVEACGTLAISAVAFGFNPAVKSGEVFGAEILTQLPIIDPKWKITPEHGAALVKALSDIESDYEK